MEQQYRLTIAICCHAKTPYFQEMLDSFLNPGMDWPETEMLICDDGSPAGGDGDTARKFATRKDLPFTVHVIRHEEHWRQAASRQQLTMEAQGRYILFFDSDDVLLPFDLKADLDFLDQHPEYCGTYGKKIFFDGQTGLLPRAGGGDYSPVKLLISPPMVMIAMIMRTEDLKKGWGFVLPDNQILPGGCAEDICMWLSCGIRKPFHFVEDFRAMYRVHPGQTTWKVEEIYRQCYRILRDHLYRVSADLREKLYEGKTFQIPVERRWELAALCGAEFADAGTVQICHQCLDIAVLAAPDDYGIREQRALLLEYEGKYAEVLREIFLMTEEHPQSAYIRCTAFQIAERAAAKLHYDVTPFTKLRRGAEDRHFSIPEKFHPLLNQTVENARRYQKLTQEQPKKVS